MRRRRPRGIRSLAALAAATFVLGLVAACGEQAPAPAGPDAQAPSFYHGDGDGEADATKTISDNISGDGSEVCNDSRVQDTDIVGDDEETWSGRKVDPAEDLTADGFTFDVADDGTTLAWNDDGKNLVQAVLIKAGGSSVVYYYNEGDPNATPDPVEDFSDDGLDGEDDKEFSHYVYCFVPQPAVKKGVKFDDADADGVKDDGESLLNGWEIRAYDDADKDGVLDANEGLVADTTTGSGDLADGEYELILAPGDYVICEVLQEGWNQSSRDSDTDGACAVGGGLADDGYGVSLSAGEIDDDNHFGNNQTTIEVWVEDGDDPAPGQTVMVTHNLFGSYRGDGSLQSCVTDEKGFCVIDNLQDGNHCARTSPAKRTPDLLVPPLDPDTPPQLARDLGTAVTPTPADADNEPVTLQTFADACVGEGAASIQPGDHVRLSLQEGEKFKGEFEFLEGLLNKELSAFWVEDLTLAAENGVVDFPASFFDNAPDSEDVGVADIHIGVYVTAAPDEGTGFFEIVRPLGASRIESDKGEGPGGTIQAASATASSVEDGGTITTEPLYCVANQIGEPPDDGGKVELIGPYKFGFLADKNLNVIEDAFGISYEQTDGSAKLKVRAKINPTKRLTVGYTCSDDTCTIDKTSGGLAKVKGFEVTLASAGGNRVRWVLTGLPDGTSKVQSGVSTKNDEIPNAEKDDNDDGLVDAVLPESCTNTQQYVIGG